MTLRTHHNVVCLAERRRMREQQRAADLADEPSGSR